MSLLADLKADAKHSVRALGKAPAFLLAAVVTLGLGIGANVALFSVLNAVLLEPLPYAAPETRLMLWSRWTGFDKTWLSEAEVLDYQISCPSLKRVAAWATDQANLTGDGEPARVGIAQISANTLATLGAEPLLGRGFTTEEDRPGGSDVAILSFELWQSRFAADPGVLDRTLYVDGRARAIVGVMPAGFRLPTDFGVDATEPSALWLPLGMNPAESERGSHSLYAAAELAPGATAASANAELATVTANRTREGLYPDAMRFTAIAVPLTAEILGEVRAPLLLLLGAVTLLMLIASTNVASLLLARAELRQREVAIRSALGAARGRLLRQFLAEGLVLAVPSLVLGIAIGGACLQGVRSFGLEGVPRAAAAEIDGRVLGFAVSIALFATLLFSLAPALRTLRPNLVESLREGGTQSTASGRRQRLRGLLVMGEVALSVVLLLGAGLLLRSLWALQHVDLGFEPRGVLTLRLSLPEAGYEKPEAVVAFYRQLLEKTRALPGVQAAGLLRLLPLGSPIGDWGLDIEGYEEAPGRGAKGDWQVATDGALEALGERLVRGRAFAASDNADSEPVALINETMARSYWPGRDALGGRLRQGNDVDRPWVRVVGIVRDVRHNGVTAPVKEKFYRPHAQFPASVGFAPRTMQLVVRTAGEPLALVAPIRTALQGLDPNVPAAAIRPMTEVVAAAVATSRLAGGLLAAFALLALLLSAVGIYGLLSYLVSERRQEIGIRMAIGADARDVLRLVLGQGLRMTLSGLAAGWLAALALARLTASLLHDVKPHDPATFLLAPLFLAAAAAAASYLPARRAAQVDPVAALRSE